MRFFYLATILVGVSFLLSAAGFATPVAGGILKQLGLMDVNDNQTLSGVKDSGLWSDLNLILAGLGSAAIVIGVFGRSPDISLLSAGLVLTLTGAILADYLSIYLRLYEFGVDWIQWVGVLIYGSLIVGIFITAIDFWKGSD
jgi:hypothetical protein